MTLKNFALSALVSLGAVLMTACTSSPAVQQTPNKGNDLAQRNLVGQVKCLVEESYYVEPDGKLRLGITDSLLYDKAGFLESQHITELIGVDSADFIHRRMLYKRDTLGNVLEYKSFEGDNLLRLERFVYNAQGLKTEYIQESDDARYSMLSPEEEQVYEGSRGVKTHIYYSYNDKGQLTGEKHYLRGPGLDTLFREKVYSYNAQGLCTEMRQPERNNSYAERYVYDSKGNRTEVHQTTDACTGDTYLRERTSYDDKGRVVETTQYAEDGELIHSVVLKHDDKANELEIQEKWSESEAMSSRFSYEQQYDPHGNWTEYRTYKWDEGKKNLVSIKKRRITYY